MTVGQEIAERTGFKLLHNHMTIEPIIRIFDWGTPQFFRLVEELRIRILEEAVDSDLRGLVCTFAWPFNLPEEAESIERYIASFRVASSRIMLVELEAAQDVRLQRNESELRLHEKPSMRDIAASRARLLDADAKHRFNSLEGELAHWPEYMRIDATKLSAAETADLVIDRFRLARLAADQP